jgi:hypothetical protein
MARRHENQLPLEVTTCGAREALDEGLPVAALALLVDGKQVTRPVKAILGPFGLGGLHDLHGHAVPTHRAALHGISRKNLHCAVSPTWGAVIDQRSKPRIGVLVLHTRTTVGPQQHGNLRRCRRIAIETTVRRQVR